MEIINLHTNDCCFWCLNETKVSLQMSESGCSKNIGYFDKKFEFSINSLCHYLKIKLMKVSWGENKEINELGKVEVNLCSECHKIGEHFTELYKKLEKVQIELDHCMEEVHWQITESERKPELLENYKRKQKIASEARAVGQQNFVDNLRKEVEQQSLKLRNSYVEGGNEFLEEEMDEDGNISEDSEDSYHEINLQGDSTALNSVIKSEEESSDYNSATARIDGEKSGDIKPVITGQKIKTVRLANIKKWDFNYKLGVYECSACKAQYKTSFGANHHYNTKHTLKKCRFCNQNDFASFYELQIHLESCSKAEKVKKSVQIPCSSTSLSSSGEIGDKNGTLFYSFDEKAGLYVCLRCGEEFENINTVNDHYDKVHLSLRFECCLCNKRFMARRSLKRHEKVCRESEEKLLEKTKNYTFSCYACGRKYASKRNLKEHFKRSHLMKKCEQCDKTFATGGSLEWHKNKEHSGSIFKCNACSKMLTTRKSYYRHLKVYCKYKGDKIKVIC